MHFCSKQHAGGLLHLQTPPLWDEGEAGLELEEEEDTAHIRVTVVDK